jgi:hypothetical protein
MFWNENKKTLFSNLIKSHSFFYFLKDGWGCVKCLLDVQNQNISQLAIYAVIFFLNTIQKS